MTEAHNSKTSNITDSLANKSLRVSTILVETEQMKTQTLHKHGSISNRKLARPGRDANLCSRRTSRT